MFAGTEFKQIFMHESTATAPDSLKASLADPVLRHRHLVDADIEEQTMDSLVNVKLHTDHDGNIVAFPEGGMRRIDYVLTRKDTPVVRMISLLPSSQAGSAHFRWMDCSDDGLWWSESGIEGEKVSFTCSVIPQSSSWRMQWRENYLA